MQTNYQTPPPIPPVNEPKKKLPWTWIAIGAAFVLALVVQYIIQGPAHGDKQVARMVELLRKDSVELNTDHSPGGGRYAFQDIRKEINTIYDLGRPHRYNSDDSAFLFANEKTAPIAKYNVEKSRQVLEEVVPMWRKVFVMSANTTYSSTPSLVAALDKEDDRIVNFFSPAYLDPQKIDADYTYFAPFMHLLGFKEANFAFSPNSIGKTFAP